MENKQKEAVFPSYYKEFKCIGGACEDTCCAGWYLPVDEKSYKKYKKVKHVEMKKRLDKEIVAKKGAVDPSCVAKIKQKNGKCAFLNKEGWCDIYTHLGEGYLSESCTLYPRTTNQLNGRLEHSITLSCPEAARKVLLGKEGIKFENESIKNSNVTISAILNYQAQKPKKWEDYLDSYRTSLFKVLQNRNMTLNQRLESIDYMMEAVDAIIKRHQLKQLQSALDKPYTATKGIEIVNKQSFDKIIEYLKTLAEGKKLHSKSYQEVLQQVVTMDYTTYQKANQTYQNLFADKLDYILENYFVNYVYERCVPVDAKTPYESIQRIIAYYQFIQLHLMGIVVAEGMLKEEDIVMFVQGFTKVYDHGEEYINKVLKMI